VALAIGAQTSLPVEWQESELVLSFFYFVLALPYTYRTLDIGLRAIPLSTLTEAARSLGANQLKVIALVLTPVVRGAVVSSVFITLAFSLGEFTLTSLLHWQTFTTWVTYISQSNILGAIALSVFSIVGAIVLLMIIGLVTMRRTRKTVVEEI
jgi:putative spermidine/putrescine transport system permease protein